MFRSPPRFFLLTILQTEDVSKLESGFFSGLDEGNVLAEMASSVQSGAAVAEASTSPLAASEDSPTKKGIHLTRISIPLLSECRPRRALRPPKMSSENVIESLEEAETASPSVARSFSNLSPSLASPTVRSTLNSLMTAVDSLAVSKVSRHFVKRNRLQGIKYPFPFFLSFCLDHFFLVERKRLFWLMTTLLLVRRAKTLMRLL